MRSLGAFDEAVHGSVDGEEVWNRDRWRET